MYHPAHLSRKLRAAGMRYAKPRPMDPRRPSNAEEILAERLVEALSEGDRAEGVMSPLSSVSFDEAWPQPFENLQRM